MYLYILEEISHPTQEKHFNIYMKWLSSLGDAVITPTIPLKNTTTVSPGGTINEGGRAWNVRIHNS